VSICGHLCSSVDFVRATVASLLFTLALATPATAAPQRIVSLAPSVTETLFALGVGDRLVGVSTYCDYPPEAARIDRWGRSSRPTSSAFSPSAPTW